MGPYSLKGSEVWAPALDAAGDGVVMGLQGFRTRGPCFHPKEPGHPNGPKSP